MTKKELIEQLVKRYELQNGSINSMHDLSNIIEFAFDNKEDVLLIPTIPTLIKELEKEYKQKTENNTLTVDYSLEYINKLERYTSMLRYHKLVNA